LWRAPAGGRATRQQQLPTDPYVLVDAQMASSSSRLAVTTVMARPSSGFGEDHSSEAWRDVFGGPSGGPLTALSPRCGGATLLRSLDASENLIAYQACDAGEDAVIVDPAAAGDGTSVPGAGTGVRIAGRYLAWLENPQLIGQLGFGHRYDIVVYDRTAGAVAYRIPASSTFGGVHSFDIQSDGKLALSYVKLSKSGDESPMHVAWASPSEPRLHATKLPVAETYEVALEHDRIAFERGTAADIIDLADIGVAPLSGRAHLVGRNGEFITGHPTFDFDGHRLTWWSYGCSSARIHVVAANAATVPTARHGCPLRFRRPPVVSSGHTVKFQVNCFGFVFCSVRSVRFTAGRRLVATGKGTKARLTAGGLARLRARGHLSVRVHAEFVDAVGRHERRTTHAVLRVPKPH
jgi:hypothetical protein